MNFGDKFTDWILMLHDGARYKTHSDEIDQGHTSEILDKAGGSPGDVTLYFVCRTSSLDSGK